LQIKNRKTVYRYCKCFDVRPNKANRVLPAGTFLFTFQKLLCRYYHTGLTKPKLKSFLFEVIENKNTKVEVKMKYM
jgi:hypothetical protein